ncbi:MAG: hypothetical protein HY270_09295 [Deltaproteobacteria bacterium]|nr:hypothetical protein [Deltaproteobacteria bacterium]
MTIDELITSVDISLDAASVSACAAADANADGTITIDEIIRSVGVAQNGCPHCDAAVSAPSATRPAAVRSSMKMALYLHPAPTAFSARRIALRIDHVLSFTATESQLRVSSSAAAGLLGTDIAVSRDSGGTTGTPGNPKTVVSGSGPVGSAILLSSMAFSTVVGSCDDAFEFCTPVDDPALRGMPQTFFLTTGAASAVVHNANGNDGIDVGPFSLSGTPVDCSKLNDDPPSVSGFGLVGALPALTQPMLGDIVTTVQLFAQ